MFVLAKGYTMRPEYLWQRRLAIQSELNRHPGPVGSRLRVHCSAAVTDIRLCEARERHNAMHATAVRRRGPAIRWPNCLTAHGKWGRRRGVPRTYRPRAAAASVRSVGAHGRWQVCDLGAANRLCWLCTPCSAPALAEQTAKLAETPLLASETHPLAK
jgi:hypothetical protein